MLADLTPTARKVIFGVVALALAGLAAFGMRSTPDTPADPTAPTVTSPGTVVTVDPDPQATAADPQATDPAVPGATVPMPLGQGTVNKVAATAARFVGEYATYRYDQDDAKKTAALKGYLGEDSAVDLTGVIPTGPAKADLARTRHVATATARADRAVTVSSNLVALQVTATVRTTAAGKTSTATRAYLVTLIDDTGWAVHDIQPFGAHDADHGTD